MIFEKDFKFGILRTLLEFICFIQVSTFHCLEIVTHTPEENPLEYVEALVRISFVTFKILDF